MSNDILQLVGDGVTREFVVSPSHTSVEAVYVNGVSVPFNQPAWNKVRLSVAPAAGAVVLIAFVETVRPSSGAPSGGDTGGGGSSESAVSAYPGEVRSFAIGQVPTGWQQISGPTSIQNPQPADILVKHLHYGSTLTPESTTARQPIRHGGKLYWQLWTSTYALALQEVDVDHQPVGAPWLLSSGVFYAAGNYTRLTPLSDGTFLRFGGRIVSGLQHSSMLTRLNTNRTTSALLDSPVPLTGVAAQAGDGKVYGVAYDTDTLVAFNPYENVYDAQTYSTPFRPSSIRALPDGNLLLVSTQPGSGQFCVFNYQSKACTAPVAFECLNSVYAGGDVLLDGRGAVVVNTVFGGVTACTLVTFDPYGTSVTYTPLRMRTQEAILVVNPYNGSTTFCYASGNAVYAEIYELLADYTPQGTVRAVKL